MFQFEKYIQEGRSFVIKIEKESARYDKQFLR